MTSHGEWFRDTRDLKTPRFIEIGDDTTHPITQISKVPLSIPCYSHMEKELETLEFGTSGLAMLISNILS